MKTIDIYQDNAIVIAVQGGVIFDIENIPPGVTVRVVDFDTEGETDDVVKLKHNQQEAFVSDWKAEVKKSKKPACDECGRLITGNVVGCPDGAEICQACFDGGAH